MTDVQQFLKGVAAGESESSREELRNDKRMKTAGAPSDVVVVTSGETKQSNPEPGLTRLIGAYNEKLFLAEHRMEKGWVGGAHSHYHEQIVYVISGHLKVTCAGKTFDVRAGDSFVVRGGIEHQASAVEPTRVVDVFTPCRNDYL